MMMGLTSAQQKQQPKELLLVLALAMVNVDDVRAETPSISTSSLVCSSLVARRSEEAQRNSCSKQWWGRS
jgi:hypothetical protein